MILSSNGQNIYPEEIENILNNLPYVRRLDGRIEVGAARLGATGILMSAFHQDGVAWIRTSDLAEAVTRISPTQIRERTGQVYDVTGPERVSMTQLRDAMTEQLNESIELACLPPEEFTEKLLANGMPEVVARWVADYQRTSSDPLLPSTTQVLPMLLDRSPASPQLVPHDYQDINYESTHR